MFRMFATVFILLGEIAALAVDPNVFTASTRPRDGYVPNLGNGFIGYDVGCPNVDESSSAGYLFVTGTYSGNSTVTPSRRALIPQQQSVFVEYASCGAAPLLAAEWSASLDIQRGAFSNTSVYDFQDCSCSIELTWIAHRTMPNISALQISAYGADSNCMFTLSSCNGNWSADVEEMLRVKSEYSTGSTVYGIVYETLLPEKPEGGPLTNVTTVYNEIPFVISGGEKFTSLLQIFSSAWVSSGGTDVSLEAQFYTFATLYASYSWDDLLNRHVAGWSDLWQSGIEISGNDTVAAAVNGSLYYILSSVSEFSLWSISPGGLPKNSYNGHIFWDCETWILPALVPFFPGIAESFVQYRTQRLAEATHRAQTRGYDGAMFPWESAYTGIDVTPIPNIEGEYEIHVTADIALAARLVWYWTGDDKWIFGEMWDMVIGCANYFVSRVDCLISSENECSQYTLYDVMPPDELAGVVNHSVYTNAAAAVLLDWVAGELIELSGTNDNENAIIYQNIADNMYIPESAALWTGIVHPEYDGYTGQPINQADTVLLQFPLLFEMADDIAYNDLRYYENLTSVPGVTKGYYTGDSSYSIAYLNLYRKEQFVPSDGADLKALADHQFEQAFSHIDFGFYYIWHETVSGGHVNFVAGAGGFLQNLLYGYGGIQANSDGLIIDYPVLPHLGITELRFRHLKYNGATLTFSFDSSSMSIAIVESTLYVYVEADDTEDMQWDLFTTLSENGNHHSVSLNLQKIFLTTEKINPEKKKRKKDDDIEEFFKEYYPYIIIGGVFLLNGCAYLLYKCIYKFPIDDGTINLFTGGRDSALAESKL